MSIGERITELRKKQEMSQGQLADAMGVSRQAVSKWENDQTSPDTIRLIQLAEVLDSDVEYLATGRTMVYRRPPIVIKTVETKIEEKPVEKVVEKVVERVVKQPPEIQYVEKPVIQKVYRTRYVRNPLEYCAAALAGLLVGFLIGYLI